MKKKTSLIYSIIRDGIVIVTLTYTNSKVYQLHANTIILALGIVITIAITIDMVLYMLKLKRYQPALGG